jgi:hypothetical protein
MEEGAFLDDGYGDSEWSLGRLPREGATEMQMCFVSASCSCPNGVAIRDVLEGHKIMIETTFRRILDTTQCS